MRLLTVSEMEVVAGGNAGWDSADANSHMGYIPPDYSELHQAQFRAWSNSLLVATTSATANGALEENEDGTRTVYIDLNGNGTIDETATYDADGNFLSSTITTEGHAFWDAANNNFDSYLASVDSDYLGYYSDYDSGQTGEWFACLGASAIVGGGVCVAGDGLYAYGSVSYGPLDSPIDVTIGYASDADAYLTGLGVQGSSFAGAGFSYDAEGNIVGDALITGTPGVSVSYGVNLGDALVEAYDSTIYAFDEAFEVFSDGVYRELGSPYDMPPEDEFMR